MAIDYLHGVETIESEIGGQTVQVVASSIVALIGIAPQGPANQLALCSNATDDAQFGNAVPGFNIPKTLQIIRNIAGGSPILIVNVFNAATNTKQITTESQTVTNGKLQLANAPIGTVSIFESDGTTIPELVAGTDYSIDSFGNFLALSANVADGTVYKFSYKTLDDSTVTATQLIGGIDENGDRTGIALFDLAFNTFGYNPKIFIAPNYSSLSVIAAAFSASATKFRAIYLLDAPYGITPSQAIAGRGPSGDIVFNTQDQRAYLLYPYLKTFDDYLQADADYPYSAFMAGMIIKVDANFGYWFSPSNKSMSPTVMGSERVIEWRINDSSCEANLLNAAGVTTIAAGFGTGILTWGNRDAAFPSSTSVKNFISIRRSDDMVIQTMEQASLQFLDLPLSQAQIDTIREAGNALIRVLISRGAALPGSMVIYDPSVNPAENLAAGKVRFQRKWMIGTPTEEIIYDDVLDISLLTQFS